MGSITKRAIKWGLILGVVSAFIKVLIDYYQDGTFHILSTVLFGALSSVLWVFIQQYELKKQAEKESIN